MRNKITIVSLLALLMVMLHSCAVRLPEDRSKLVQNYQPNYLDIQSIGVSAHAEIIIQGFFVHAGYRNNQHSRYFRYQVVADSILADLNQVFQTNVSFNEQRELDVVITVHYLEFIRAETRGATDIEVNIYDHKTKKLIKSYRKALEKVVKPGDDYKRKYNHLSHPSNIMYQVLNQVMDEIKMTLLADRDFILESLSANEDMESPN